MNENTGRMVTGLFPDRASAERAYQSASSRGYGKDDINLVMSDETRKRHFATDAGTRPTSAPRPRRERVWAAPSGALSAPSLGRLPL